MRSAFCHFRCVAAILLAAAVSIPTALPAADTVVVSINNDPDESAAKPDDNPAANPFTTQTRLGIPVTSGPGNSLLFMRPGAGTAEPDEISVGTVSLQAEAYPAAGRTAGGDDHPSFVAADPAAVTSPELSSFDNITLRNASLPGFAALGVIGLALAYAASNDAKEEERRARGRQRTRGFRQMAPPIYNAGKPARMRLTPGSESDASR